MILVVTTIDERDKIHLMISKMYKTVNWLTIELIT